MRALLLALSMLLAPAAMATAEVFTRGPFEVRITPFPSTFLTPEIAAEYGLTRSESQAILNISVYDTRLERAVKTVPATLSGTRQNLLGQAFNLRFQEVREGDAVYYLVPFRISDDEIINVELEAIPEGDTRAVTARFSQRFYKQ